MIPILQKAANEMMGKVSQENRKSVDKAVTAGLMLMFGNDETYNKLEMVANPESRKDIASTIATGISGLIVILYKQSQNSMKFEVLIMSGFILMCHALDFAARKYNIPMDQQVIRKCTLDLAYKACQKFGVKSPEQLNELIAKGANEIKAHNEKYSGQQPAGAM